MSNDHCLRHFTAPVIFALNTYWWKSFRFVFCDDDKALKIQNSLRYCPEGTGAFYMRLISRKYLLLGGSFNSFLRTDPQRIEIQCKPPGAVFLRGEEETKDPAVCKSFLQNAAPHLLIMSLGEPVRSDQTDSFVRSVHCAGRADRLRLLTVLSLCYNVVYGNLFTGL